MPHIHTHTHTVSYFISTADIRTQNSANLNSNADSADPNPKHYPKISSFSAADIWS